MSSDIQAQNDAIAQRCFELNLLKTSMECEKCLNPTIYKNSDGKDGLKWECPNNACRKRYSIRKYSIFENSNLNLGTILCILAYIVNKLSPDAALKHLKMRKQTISKWYGIFRERLFLYYQLKPEYTQMGGIGKTVEIDECCLGKRKYEKGRIHKQLWIFGGIERENKKNWFIVPVQRRNAATLLPIIKLKIANGTSVNTDRWKAYRKLNELLPEKQFEHNWINHDTNFVSRTNQDVHTQNIKCFWSNLRRFYETLIQIKGKIWIYLLLNFIFVVFTKLL